MPTIKWLGKGIYCGRNFILRPGKTAPVSKEEAEQLTRDFPKLVEFVLVRKAKED